MTSVANGSLYVAEAQIANSLNILHVYGTPYAMGYAHGQIFQKEISEMVPQFIEYLDSQVAQYFQWLPKVMTRESS